MQTINLLDAKNSLGKLVDAAQGGEDIIIARNGKPAVKLVPLNYGEWSPVVQQFLWDGACDKAAFSVDRSDLLSLPERDLF